MCDLFTVLSAGSVLIRMQVKYNRSFSLSPFKRKSRNWLVGMGEDGMVRIFHIPWTPAVACLSARREFCRFAASSSSCRPYRLAFTFSVILTHCVKLTLTPHGSSDIRSSRWRGNKEQTLLSLLDGKMIFLHVNIRCYSYIGWNEL